MYDVKPITSIAEFDCGATCLKMLLSYYGIDVTLDELNKECNTRLVGCTAGDIKRAGTKYGLEMHAYQMSYDELVKQDRPAIIWWKYGHYCMFCGKNDKGYIVICNPDRGRYGVPESSFKAFYSGVALFNGEPVDITIKCAKSPLL